MSHRDESLPFNRVIETVEAIPFEDREILVDILQKRQNEARRSQLVQQIAEVRQDYTDGNISFGSVDDFLAALEDD
jgi:hypothetical protein